MKRSTEEKTEKLQTLVFQFIDYFHFHFFGPRWIHDTESGSNSLSVSVLFDINSEKSEVLFTSNTLKVSVTLLIFFYFNFFLRAI